MPERTYTEEEVAAIYARAAEKQRVASTRDASEGLTLAEVEQAGREAGLDPAAIRAAANELDSTNRFPVRSNVAVAERWIEAPMSTDAWEEVVATLRHQLGTGEVTTLGDAQEWTHTSASGARTTITVSPRGERTLLRVMTEYAGLQDERKMGRLMAAFPAIPLGFIAGGVVAEGLALGDLMGFAAALLVLFVVMELGGSRLAKRIRKSRARQAEQIQQIADDLAERIAAGRSVPVAHASSAEPQPLLDPTLLDDPAPRSEAAAEKRRQRS